MVKNHRFNYAGHIGPHLILKNSLLIHQYIGAFIS